MRKKIGSRANSSRAVSFEDMSREWKQLARNVKEESVLPEMHLPQIPEEVMRTTASVGWVTLGTGTVLTDMENILPSNSTAFMASLWGWECLILMVM